MPPLPKPTQWRIGRSSATFNSMPSARSSDSFSRRLLAMTELAPTDPPFVVSSGLQLASALRRRVRGEPGRDLPSSWEQLLSLRQGPGADGFVVWPLPGDVGLEREPLLERCVEILALVEAVRDHSARHPGQHLDCFLRKDRLQVRRERLQSKVTPVVVRLGSWYVQIEVGDEHPRALRERVLHAFETNPQPLGHLRLRRLRAGLVVSLLPLPLGEAVHLHRWGLEGPWLGWSRAGALRQVGVLAAHHFVLEGPGLACLRVDFRRRLRAMRLALGLDAEDPEWDGREDFSARDAAPFTLQETELDEFLDLSLSADQSWRESVEAVAEDALVSSGYGTHLLVTGDGSISRTQLPASLEALAREGHWSWLHPGRWTGRGLDAPSLRFATLERGAFSLSSACYAYCCAQHQAMADRDSHYRSQGFTFVVPQIPGSGAFKSNSRRRARPILCSFHTRDGRPESSLSFNRRFKRRMAEADAGDDLLSHVMRDLFEGSLPALVKSAAVHLFERAPRDGGTFLGGRGLVAYAQVPDEDVDPVATYAGVFEGLFSGSCQERGGVALSIIDRGYRRDLCAAGTGLFASERVMDTFWKTFARLYREQGL